MIVFLWMGACGSSEPDRSGRFVGDSHADDSDVPDVSDDSTADDSGTADHDGDGWTEPDDCDDTDASVYPNALEACVDHKDNDCDGVVDHCDLERDAWVDGRFVDPDADGWKTNAHGGFGASMGFHDSALPGLWISPQGLAPEPIWRQASAGGWTSAEVSGFQAYDIDDPVWSTVETSGDFDADGARDLVLAEWTEHGITAHLFYAPIVARQSLDTASASVRADEASDYWTWAHMRAVGDQTGDGSDDLLLGSYGRAWIVAGPVSGDIHASDDAVSAPTTVAAAWSATGLDFDGDGVRDLAAVDPFDASQGPELGAAYVYLGPTAGDLEPTSADRGWFGDNGVHAEQVGHTIDAGDVDGDGRDELIVRSTNYYVDEEPGAVYLIDHHAADGGRLRIVARALIEAQEWDHVGATEGDVADFDHDGRSDLVVSSTQHHADSKGYGYVSIFLGPLDGHLVADTDANLTLRGSTGEYGLGFHTVAGDIDDDGVLELAISSVVYDEDKYLFSVVDIVTPALLFEP